jgi:Uma2 family endonuclease
MLAKDPFTHWPDHTQLPESDGTFVKNFQEHPQSLLLTDAIKPRLAQLHPDGQYCIGQDSGIYWRLVEPPELPERGAVSPDWFYVPDVPPMLNGEYRRSYVLWRELVAPLIVLEFVSGDGSEERDRTPRTGKFWIYERVIRPAYYGIYEVQLSRIEIYELVGSRYQLMEPNTHGHFPIEPMGVALGIWQGEYLGVTVPWMRWYDNDGILLPLGEERAEYSEGQAQQERQRAVFADQRALQADQRALQAEEEAHRERQKSAALAERLRSLGIDPDTL